MGLSHQDHPGLAATGFRQGREDESSLADGAKSIGAYHDGSCPQAADELSGVAVDGQRTEQAAGTFHQSELMTPGEALDVPESVFPSGWLWVGASGEAGRERSAKVPGVDLVERERPAERVMDGLGIASAA